MGCSSDRLSAYGRGTCAASSVDWEVFPELCTPVRYPSGVELLQQDRAIQSVHIVHEGMVKLEHINAAGRSSVIGLRTSGSALGAAQLLLGQPSPVTAVTTVPTRVSSIPTARFLVLFSDNPAVCARVGKSLSQDAHQDILLAIERAAYDARERLERFLAQVAAHAEEWQTTPARMRLPFTQADLAQLIGVTPQHHSYLLAQLERQGSLARRRGAIIWRSLGRDRPA